jgi:hypothetical protein
VAHDELEKCHRAQKEGMSLEASLDMFGDDDDDDNDDDDDEGTKVCLGFIPEVRLWSETPSAGPSSELVAVTLRFKGQTRTIIKCVLGSNLTHMVTHGIETNVTSSLYNKSFVQIAK